MGFDFEDVSICKVKRELHADNENKVSGDIPDHKTDVPSLSQVNASENKDEIYDMVSENIKDKEDIPAFSDVEAFQANEINELLQDELNSDNNDLIDVNNSNDAQIINDFNDLQAMESDDIDIINDLNAEFDSNDSTIAKDENYLNDIPAIGENDVQDEVQNSYWKNVPDPNDMNDVEDKKIMILEDANGLDQSYPSMDKAVDKEKNSLPTNQSQNDLKILKLSDIPTRGRHV